MTHYSIGALFAILAVSACALQQDAQSPRVEERSMLARYPGYRIELDNQCWFSVEKSARVVAPRLTEHNHVVDHGKKRIIMQSVIACYTV